MPLDYPQNPKAGQVYSFNGSSWRWNGAIWSPVQPEPSAPAVFLIGYGGEVILDSSATIDLPAPSVTVGDLMVIALMARSAVTTPPGWTRISDSGLIPGDSTQQRSVVFSKPYQASDPAKITVTQATAGRLLGQLVAIRATGGVPSLYSQAGKTTATESSPGGTAEILMPSIAFPTGPSLSISLGTFVYANLDTTTDIAVDTGGLIQTSLPSAMQNRLGLFVGAHRGGTPSTPRVRSQSVTVMATGNYLCFVSP